MVQSLVQRRIPMFSFLNQQLNTSGFDSHHPLHPAPFSLPRIGLDQKTAPCAEFPLRLNFCAMKLHNILPALLLAFLPPLGWAQPPDTLQAIPQLDVSRYLGRWYEIAKFPNRFQQKCVADTSANYTLRDDGSLSVLNQCRLADGTLYQAQGQARQLGGKLSARLEVRFAPAWLSFLPLVWGDYWVVDLDDRYELAAVSEPGQQYLWILARTPVVDASKYNNLLLRLTKMGLNVQKLETSAQTSSAPPQ